MRATEDCGSSWYRWRERWLARDHRSRIYILVTLYFVVRALIDNDPHSTTAMGVCALVAYVAYDLHSRLAEITASMHTRFDEQNAKDRVR